MAKLVQCDRCKVICDGPSRPRRVSLYEVDNGQYIGEKELCEECYTPLMDYLVNNELRVGKPQEPRK